MLLVATPAVSVYCQIVSPSPPPEVQPDIIRVNSNLVGVEVFAIDSKGRPLTDLNANEVEVRVDGVRHELRSLTLITSPVRDTSKRVKSKETEKIGPIGQSIPIENSPPKRWISIVFDDLSISFENVEWAKKGLSRFIAEDLSPGDHISIVTTSGIYSGQLPHFTNNKEFLFAAIRNLRFNPSGHAGITSNRAFQSTPMERARAAGANISQEMIDSDKRRDREILEQREEIISMRSIEAVKKVVSDLDVVSGPKCVFLLSDGYRLISRSLNGFDGESPLAKPVKDLIKAANMASVSIHTFDTGGLRNSGFTSEDETTVARLWRPGKGGTVINSHDEKLRERRERIEQKQDGLKEIAKRTGGTARLNSNDLESGLSNAFRANSYYFLYFEPENDIRPEGGRLEIKVNRANVTIRHRETVFRERSVSSASFDFGDPMRSPVEGTDFRVNVRPLFARDDATGSFLRVLVHASKLGPNKLINPSLKVMLACYGVDGTQIYVGETTPGIPNTENSNEYPGFYATFLVPVSVTGLVHVRGFVLDPESKEYGSASSYVSVSKPESGQSVLSSIVLDRISNIPFSDEDLQDNKTIQQSSLEANLNREFKIGETIVFAIANYDNRSEKKTDGNLILVNLLKDDKKYRELYRGPLNLSTAHRGEIQLTNDFPVGSYLLHIDLVSPTGKSMPSAAQVIDFEVVD